MDIIPSDAAEEAAKLAVPFEGFSSKPYPDPASGGEPYTIGYGSIRDINNKPVTLSTPPITVAQGFQLLSRDIHSALLTVAQDVKVPLSKNEWAALADLIYNIGVGNFASSTLLKLLNAKDYSGAAEEFEKWDLASGKKIAGLLRRRIAEEDLFDQN